MILMVTVCGAAHVEKIIASALSVDMTNMVGPSPMYDGVKQNVVDDGCVMHEMTRHNGCIQRIFY